jgi:magnesium transporter
VPEKAFSVCIKDSVFIDPAVASGPLITTLNDLVAVIVYYGLSWLLIIEVFNMV